MTLVKCPECQNKISKEAAFCPNCGGPLKKKSGSSGCLIILILSALIVWGIYEANKGEKAGGSVSPQMEKLRESGQSLTETALKMKEMSKTFNISMDVVVALDTLFHEHGMTLNDLDKCLTNLSNAQKKAALADPNMLSSLKALEIDAVEFVNMDLGRAFEKIAKQYVKLKGNLIAENAACNLIPFLTTK